MKILVTGGTGFIGCHLIERLRKRGDEVRCIAKDRLNAVLLESLDVEVVLADLNNGFGWDSILNGVEYIYHLAGVTRATWTKDYYRGNYFATKRFIEACANNCTTLKRFVYVSSLAAVGPSLDGHLVTEETPYHPVSHYGKSKMMGELAVFNVRDRLPITIVRPSAVYGPRERDMYEYFRLIKRGIQPLMGFRKKIVNLIYSDDLVGGILLAGEHPSAVDETYFIGSEESYPIEEIGRVMAHMLNCCPMRLRIPDTLVYAVAAISGAVGKITSNQILFNLQKAKECLQSAWICSVDKAKSHLGFRQKVSLEDGMEKTYLWYRENGWL